jgi:threonine dehydratase
MQNIWPLIDAAAARVYAVVEETPLVPLPGSASAYAKLEQLQTSGSFTFAAVATPRP